MQTLMHWFKCSSVFNLQYCYCNGWGDEMTGTHFLFEELFHRDIRRLERLALHPPAWAWQCNTSLRLGLAMETSAALRAGPRRSVPRKLRASAWGKGGRTRRVEWLCRMQSWKLPEKIAAAGMQHRLQDGGRASAATGGKKWNCAWS